MNLVEEETSFWKVVSTHKKVQAKYSPVVGDGRRIYSIIGVELNADEQANQRTVYSLLDYFGDVGGLLSFLQLIAQFLMYLNPNTPMSHFIVKRIFKYQDRGRLRLAHAYAQTP